MKPKTKFLIAVVVMLCVACLSITAWAVRFRKTEFSKEIWDQGPGWARWRMRDDVCKKITNGWFTKDRITSNLGRRTGGWEGSDLPSLYEILPSGFFAFFETQYIAISFDDNRQAVKAVMISNS